MASVACIAVLALLAQANAFSIGCNDNTQAICLSSAPSCMSSGSTVISNSPIVVPTRFASVDLSGSEGSGLPSFDFSGSQAAQSTERVDRNVYQISLDNNGPNSVNSAPVVRSQKQAPVVQRPTITLPARIPGPRTISNQCRCVKTIVKPQVYEQLITVPIVQRYIQSSYRPVVEKIHYQAVPANSNVEVDVSGAQTVDVQSLGLALEGQRGLQAQSYVPVEVSSLDGQVEAPTCEQAVQTVSFPSCY